MVLDRIYRINKRNFRNKRRGLSEVVVVQFAFLMEGRPPCRPPWSFKLYHYRCGVPFDFFAEIAQTPTSERYGPQARTENRRNDEWRGEASKRWVDVKPGSYLDLSIKTPTP